MPSVWQPATGNRRILSKEYRWLIYDGLDHSLTANVALHTSNNTMNGSIVKIYGTEHQAHQQKLQFADTPDKKTAHMKRTLAPAATICCIYSFTTVQLHTCITMITTNQVAMIRSWKRRSRKLSLKVPRSSRTTTVAGPIFSEAEDGF